jgi:hypothetical protein
MEQTRQLVIGGTDARKLYPTASPEWKAAFESSFGKEYFSQNPTERIKTFADACEVLDIDPRTVLDKKLETVIKALNFLANGNKIWIPDYDNSSERKWYCWWWLNKPGFRLDGLHYAHSVSSAGPRLVFITEELARYAAAQFLELFKEYYVMQPESITEQVAAASKQINDFREITSFEIACTVKGYDPAKVLPDVSMYPERHRAALLSVARLFIINEAVNYLDNGNENWVPDYNDGDEEKHYHWVDLEVDANNPSGFRLYVIYYTDSNSCVGPRLSYYSENGARHVFTHFEEDVRNFFLLK